MQKKKMKFHEKIIAKNIFILWGMLKHNIFSKLYIVYYKTRQENTKVTVSFPGKTMLKLKIIQILPDLVISNNQNFEFP